MAMEGGLVSEHPTTAELEEFVQGSLLPGSFWKTARHLLRGCPPCNALLASHYEVLIAPISRFSPDTVAAHGGILRRAFSFSRSYSRYQQSEEIRRKRIAAVLSEGGGLEALMSRPNLHLRGLGTLKALLDRSWDVRHENPKEMVSLTRFAVKIVRTLDSYWHNEHEIADWQSRAWGELGNALRVCDDLDEAERIFGFAFEFFLQGTHNLQLKARLHDLHASFLGSRRQFDLAFTALDIVHSTYLELGDLHLANKALVAKAMYLHYSGKSEEALGINESAMPLIDRARDESVFFFSVHNHIRFLLSCGQVREAHKALFRHMGDLQSIDGRIYKLRLRWLQAQVSAGLGKWESAEEGLLYVKEGFEQEDMGFHAALASLELALVWMRQDRHEETEKIVLKACEVFIALRIQREALGSIMVLKEAFARHIGTIEILEERVDYLLRGNAFPSVRF
jgi:tetratricopeptide (TPR) repeat protein